MKFKVCEDLATACKLSIQTLLRYASHKIYSYITLLLMLNRDTLGVINKFIGLHFYQNVIIPNSWFHIMEKNQMKYEDLENKLLTLTDEDDQPIFNLKILKLNLFFLIAKIASCKASQAQKAQYLINMKKTFSFESDQELIELYNQ